MTTRKSLGGPNLTTVALYCALLCRSWPFLSNLNRILGLSSYKASGNAVVVYNLTDLLDNALFK